MKHLKICLAWPLAALALPLLASCTQSEGSSSDSGISYVRKDSGNPAVAAKFEGKEVSLDDLEKTSPEIYSARLDVYKAQKQALDEFIRNQVLEGLAKKAAKPMEEFLKGEMELAKKKISEKDVEAFLKPRVPDMSKVTPDLRDQVRGMLHIQRLVSQATRANQVEFYLKRPKAAPPSFKLDGEASWGATDAPITIVEFSDFQCYYCGKARERIAELKKLYGKKIRLVYKHFPLPMHQEARPAAEASMCVHEQSADKFWKYHDILFDNQKAWSKEDLASYAKKVGADDARFQECMSSRKFRALVDASLLEGQKLGINSTPSFFVNGQLVKGAVPISEFREIIEDSVN